MKLRMKYCRTISAYGMYIYEEAKVRAVLRPLNVDLYTRVCETLLRAKFNDLILPHESGSFLFAIVRSRR